MEGNQFQGVIPPYLSGLKGIEELDVSRNNLSGNIPVFLEKLQNLRYLNLSFNEFEGEVPKKGIFGNLSAISLESNGELCGGNPGLHLKAGSLQLSMRRHRFPRVVKIILAVSGVLCFSLLLCFFIARCWIQKSRTNVASTASLEDHQFQKVTYAELLRATDGFSSANLIGTGSFGSVYKGVLGEEENIVAVKVLNLQQKGASKSFMAECEALRNVRHRNLIKILTACSSVDFKGNAFKALVFTFMPNGSLEQWLHPEVSNSGLLRNLGFVQRLNIAIDVASALDYLHHHAGTPVAHCDLKPSNVLLDNDMTAHVGDFGLAKLLSKNAWTSSGHASSSVGLKGSIGYVAPEYGMGSEVSLPGDVYSFGILLLEMLTGRRPTDDTFRDGLSLHKYVQMALPPMVLNIIDPRILFEEEDESDKDIDKASEQMHKCLFSLIRIGLSCSKESPRERMAMDDVLRELKATRDAFYGRI